MVDLHHPLVFEARLSPGSPTAVTVRSARRVARVRRAALRLVVSGLVIMNAAILGALLGLLYVR